MINKISSVIDVILMFFLIISTNSIYVNIEDGYSFNKYITILIIISFVCKIILFKISKEIFNKILILLGGYYSIVILISIINFSKFTINNVLYYFINFPLLLVIILLLREQNKLQTWLINFINITTLLAIISLFFWILVSNLNIIAPTDYLINKWSDGDIVASYYNIYFETQRTSILDNVIVRNSGIFAEAPMWNLILSLALMIQTLLVEGKKYKTIILVITIITVFSTTGIYILGIMVAYRIIFKMSGWKKYVSLTLLPILILLSSIVWEDKSETASASIRFDDYRAGIQAWFENIFLGSGFSNGIRVIEGHMNQAIRPNLGYSNSLFIILSQGGIILFILYFLPMLIIIVNRKYSYNIKFFVLLMMIILSTTIFVDTYVFSFIVGIMYSIALIGELEKMEEYNI